MEELNKILKEIVDISEKDIENNDKHKIISDLWTDYYKLSNELNIELEYEYDISLLLENNSFIVKQDSMKKDIDFDLLNITIDKIKNNCGISEEEATNILNWTIENAKENLSTVLKQLGKDVESDTLTGFCEIAQALTLMPLENIGVKVTKNNATDSFGYPYNHAFGTATFNILEDGNTVEKTYIIDATYRQFFTTSKCNEGMYYKKNSIAPDPGYFANEEFAKKLLMNGYVKLNDKSAILYGQPFYRASLPLHTKLEEINYYDNIINSFNNYSANPIDLEDFNLEFPKNKSRN